MAVWSSLFVKIPLKYGGLGINSHLDGIGTLKFMTSTGVFVCVVVALRRSIGCDSQTKIIILLVQKSIKEI